MQKIIKKISWASLLCSSTMAMPVKMSPTEFKELLEGQKVPPYGICESPSKGPPNLEKLRDPNLNEGLVARLPVPEGFDLQSFKLSDRDRFTMNRPIIEIPSLLMTMSDYMAQGTGPIEKINRQYAKYKLKCALLDEVRRIMNSGETPHPLVSNIEIVEAFIEDAITWDAILNDDENIYLDRIKWSQEIQGTTWQIIADPVTCRHMALAETYCYNSLRTPEYPEFISDWIHVSVFDGNLVVRCKYGPYIKSHAIDLIPKLKEFMLQLDMIQMLRFTVPQLVRAHRNPFEALRVVEGVPSIVQLIIEFVKIPTAKTSIEVVPIEVAVAQTTKASQLRQVAAILLICILAISIVTCYDYIKSISPYLQLI